MSAHDWASTPNGAGVHKSASDRAFELFFHAGRELDGVGEKGVRALQNLLAQAEGAGPVEIMAALFPPQDEQAGEEPDAEDQASESASV